MTRVSVDDDDDDDDDNNDDNNENNNENPNTSANVNANNNDPKPRFFFKRRRAILMELLFTSLDANQTPVAKVRFLFFEKGYSR